MSEPSPEVQEMLARLRATANCGDGLCEQCKACLRHQANEYLDSLAALTAENERLRAEIGIAGSPPPEGSWTQRLLLAEARTRALEAALRGMLICDDRCKRPQCVQARAALTAKAEGGGE